MIGTNAPGADKGTAMSDVARAQEVQPLDWPPAASSLTRPLVAVICTSGQRCLRTREWDQTVHKLFPL